MLVGSQVRRVAVVGGVRIPFARSMGAYAECSNQDMLVATLRALVDRYSLAGERLGDVAAGAVLKHSRDYNLVRESVLSSGLSAETPGMDLQRACGTSLEAAILMGMKIALGQIDSGIAGGVDTASDVPIGVSEGLRKILLRSSRGRSMGERLKPWLGLRPGHLKPSLPAVVEARTGLSMGQSTELMARTWQISREAQDAFALESHTRAAAAYDAGFFADLMIPFQGLAVDNNLRRDSTLEKLAKLKPAFPMQGGGTLTAGNSTPMTDGAAAVLLANEEWARARGLPVLAWLTYGKVAAVDFVHGEGLLMAPAYGVPRMLADARLALSDFDFYEIHEAFAAQVLCTLKAWESPEFCRDRLGLDGPLGTVDRARLNVNGSSLAFGHPFAATGARIVAMLAKQLAQLGARTWADFDLHRGRHGRDRDPRTLKIRDESTLRRARDAEPAATAALYSAANQSSPGNSMPRATILLTAAGLLAGCVTESPAPPAAQAPPTAVPVPGAHAELGTLLDRYFEELLELNPLLATYIGDNRYNDRLPNSIGPEQRAKQHDLNERYLAAARRIDPDALDGADRISLEIFLRERERALESERFPDYLIPVDQKGGLHTVMPALGSGTNAQPFATVKDYDNWLGRLDGFIVWMDQAIVNMREGMAKGVVQPRPVMEKVLPQLDAMIVEDPTKSDFYAPIRTLPASFTAADRERLTAAYTSDDPRQARARVPSAAHLRA